MKKLLILGAGTAGTMAANRLHRLLNPRQWEITIVDQDEIHFYQPGFLFIPFGIYDYADVVKPRGDFLPRDVRFICSPIERIEPTSNRVFLQNGERLDYDFLIIATGTQTHPEQTPGLMEHEWNRSIFEFYTADGAVQLANALQTWNGGRIVVNVVENPIKCPVAPLEFIMLADWFFQTRGIRDRVELIYATPLPGAFTKPIASRELGDLLGRKRIESIPEFVIERVDPDAKKIISYDEQEIAYDLLVSVPLNMGSEAIARSEMGDELNYVPVDTRTFLSKKYPNVFALGDAAALPTSKAGSVAHFAVECFAESFVHYVNGGELIASYDGHANCFIESGFNQGVLLDFNYDTEPLRGRYPLPGIGPFTLLEESEANHWGKMVFRWVYWNILLKGRPLPIPARMTMAGKWMNEQGASK